MDYSATFCNVNFASTLVGINLMDWTIRGIENKDVLEFCVKQSVRSSSFVYFARRNN